MHEEEEPALLIKRGWVRYGDQTSSYTIYVASGLMFLFCVSLFDYWNSQFKHKPFKVNAMSRPRNDQISLHMRVFVCVSVIEAASGGLWRRRRRNNVSHLLRSKGLTESLTHTRTHTSRIHLVCHTCQGFSDGGVVIVITKCQIHC